MTEGHFALLANLRELIPVAALWEGFLTPIGKPP
jgi:hypothetical protein